MEAPVIEKYTTYKDNQHRLWVVEAFYYQGETKPEEPTHVSIYEVGTLQSFEYVPIAKMQEYVRSQQMVLIVKPKPVKTEIKN